MGSYLTRWSSRLHLRAAPLRDIQQVQTVHTLRHPTACRTTAPQRDTPIMTQQHHNQQRHEHARKSNGQPLRPPPAEGQGSQTRAERRTGPTQGELVKATMKEHSVACGLVDIGVNLVDKSYDKDRLHVISRAREANVRAMVVTGTCVRSSTTARDLCEDASTGYPLYFTAGVHPHSAKTCTPDTLHKLRELAASPKCVAIGETGLDFNRNFSAHDVQEHWFEQHVLLAKELRKPMFLHCRDAGPRFIEILKRHLPLTAPAVVHCFTGSREELEAFLGMGMHIGITGWICDERPERGGTELAQLLPLIPPDRLMLETDAPYITPRSIRPSKARPGRNEPALLPHVCVAAAAALGCSPDELAERTTRVARDFFGLPDLD